MSRNERGRQQLPSHILGGPRLLERVAERLLDVLDRRPYDSVGKDVSNLSLIFSGWRVGFDEVHPIAYVDALKARLCRGQFCVSCSAPNVAVIVNLPYGFGDPHKHYRWHKGQSLRRAICIYPAIRMDAGVHFNLMDSLVSGPPALYALKT